jgi:hypothetical protein
MAKKVDSLNMDDRIWSRLSEQAKIMKTSRSELCERMFAEAFGFTDLIPPVRPPKMKDVKWNIYPKVIEPGEDAWIGINISANDVKSVFPPASYKFITRITGKIPSNCTRYLISLLTAKNAMQESMLMQNGMSLRQSGPSRRNNSISPNTWNDRCCIADFEKK